VGAEGVTGPVLDAVADALSNRELIKVRVLKGAGDDPDAAADRFGQLDAVQVVQVIGRTIVLYRPHPESPEIRLPR
jgi:RNA-binding protein